MLLRPYQIESVKKMAGALTRGEHPVCAVATGGGKSLLIAVLAATYPGRVLVVTHRKELLEQNERTLLGWDEADTGIYSAGLDRREASARVVFAGIQSIYRRMDEMQQTGPFRLVIIDEAHMVPPPSVSSMYRTVLEACPEAQRLGMTATPYRLSDGALHEGPDTWFTSMPVHVGIRELTEAGYLAPLVGIQTAADVDVSQVRTRAGEFAIGDLAQAASNEQVVRLAISELCTLAAQRRSWLVFCVDVAHTELVTAALLDQQIETACVLGSTPTDERAALLDQFRQGTLRALVNCEVATTGFDIPGVDCIAMLRPSQSKGLVVQMLGRGTRLADGKQDCLVLDMAGNIARHQPLDELPDVSLSAACQAQEEEERQRAAERRQAYADKHGIQASLLGPMDEPQPDVLQVLGMSYDLARSRKHPQYTNFVVTYRCLDPELKKTRWVRQWICLEYPGRWIRAQSQAWFTRRGVPMPPSARVAASQQYTVPSTILVQRQGTYDRILMERFEEV